MRDALLHDLARLPGLEIATTVEARFPLTAPPGVRLHSIRRRDARRFHEAIEEADAVWLIAPESRGRLAGMAALVESTGRRLLGPASRALRLAADKPGLMQRLRRVGVPVPETWRVPAGGPPLQPPEPPLVVKPGRGAGCQGISLVSDLAALPAAVARARSGSRTRVMIQRFVEGTAASVSLVADGKDATPLALNRQDVTPGCPFRYDGGETPLEHPAAERACERALAACRAVPGLRGYVGVDLVLTEQDAVVVEINARLTTAYLGLRRSLDVNPAGLALEAALGRLPARPTAVRRVRFHASGVIAQELPIAPAGRRSSATPAAAPVPS